MLFVLLSNWLVLACAWTLKDQTSWQVQGFGRSRADFVAPEGVPERGRKALAPRLVRYYCFYCILGFFICDG